MWSTVHCASRWKRFLRAVNPMTMKEPQYQKICPNLIDATLGGPAWQHADIIVVGFLWRDFELSYIASSMAEMGTLAQGANLSNR